MLAVLRSGLPRRSIHTAVCTESSFSLWKAPQLLHLLLLVLQSLVKMTSADYLNRYLIGNTLLSVDRSSICILLFSRLPITFVVLTREQDLMCALTLVNLLTSFEHRGVSHLCHGGRWLSEMPARRLLHQRARTHQRDQGHFLWKERAAE